MGLTIEVRRFPEGTKTAADAAAAIGVEVGQIVKSLVFAVDGEVVMALVAGSNQLDERKLGAAAGGGKARRVDADVVREATGYPIGGVPPFGHATTLAGLRRPRPARLRRGVGGGGHLERRLRRRARTRSSPPRAARSSTSAATESCGPAPASDVHGRSHRTLCGVVGHDPIERGNKLLAGCGRLEIAERPAPPVAPCGQWSRGHRCSASSRPGPGCSRPGWRT